MACKCVGKGGIELAVCLGPPPGDYEVTIPIGENYTLVVNDEGVFTRRILTDETLPFTKTLMKPVNEETLKHLPIRASIDEILCLVVEALEEAARHGSRRAKRKLEECNILINDLKKRCS